MEKKPKTYIHKKSGYRKFIDSDGLFHRWVAYKQVYDKKKYPHPFHKYQVHHKDKNKLNNAPENLELLTKYEHETKHGKERFEWIIIRVLVVMVLMLSLILNLNWLSDGIVKKISFYAITILGLIALGFALKSKKGIETIY